MGAIFLGVRHHSPACARLVASVIEAERPAHVLVEGPADFNGRIGELLLGHQLPIALFSHHREPDRTQLSWTPFCEYSPEWVALNAGHAVGAELRFIDLPAWHPALAGVGNRYADERCAEALAELCRAFLVDDTDSLWDHLVEVASPEGLEQRLAVYFDRVRAGVVAAESDRQREQYMAGWVRAAVAAAGARPVVVVTGGFHRPALRLLSTVEGAVGWPEVPEPAGQGASFLVPYSFERLDSFTGYQAGMPSPEYYQRLWSGGPERAAAELTELVVRRLRSRGVAVSTAELIAARALSAGLARLRGHRHPARADLLDGLLSTLITEDLTERPPWSRRGPMRPGAHPVVVEMVAALSGDRAGRLSPETPAPPLVRAVTGELDELGLDQDGVRVLVLTDEIDRRRSQVLHALRVLAIPGIERLAGPASGADPGFSERWSLSGAELRLPTLVEAGAYGATLPDAAGARLVERAGEAGAAVERLSEVLFDATVCGATGLATRIAGEIAAGVAVATDLGALGRALAEVLGLWRHDSLWCGAGSPLLGTVIHAAAARVLVLAEGIRGGPAPADHARLAAMAALRDTLREGELEVAPALVTVRRISEDTAVPPDLRGAAFGLLWAVDGRSDPVRAVAGIAGPGTLGDWLAGVFALARAEVVAEDSGLLAVLDQLVSAMAEPEFLIALPALRQAFAFFPPYEREIVARRLGGRLGGPSPAPMSRAAELEALADERLLRAGLA